MHRTLENARRSLTVAIHKKSERRRNSSGTYTMLSGNAEVGVTGCARGRAIGSWGAGRPRTRSRRGGIMSEMDRSEHRAPDGEGPEAIDPATHGWPPPPPPPVPARRRRGLTAIAVVRACLVFLASGIAIGRGFSTTLRGSAPSGSTAAPGGVRLGGGSGSGSTSSTVRSVAAKVDPAVVDIDTVIGTGVPGSGA